MDEKNRIKNVRIILAILAIIPIALIIYSLIFLSTSYGGDSIAEMAYTVVGIPIIVFNYWAWFYPEMIEYFL